MTWSENRNRTPIGCENLLFGVMRAASDILAAARLSGRGGETSYCHSASALWRVGWTSGLAEICLSGLQSRGLSLASRNGGEGLWLPPRKAVRQNQRPHQQ